MFVTQTRASKLQTASEKNWETERRAIDPRPRDRAEIFRAALVEACFQNRLCAFTRIRGCAIFGWD